MPAITLDDVGWRGDPALVVEALDVDGDALLAVIVARLQQARPRWWDRAACNGVGVETFFRLRVVEAAAFCASCSVRDECGADEALVLRSSLDRHGYRAGLTQIERRAAARGASS